MGYNDDDFSSESMSHSDENMSDGARDVLSRMVKSPDFFPQSRSESDQYLSYEDVHDRSTYSRIWKAVVKKERMDREKGIVFVMVGYSYKTIKILGCIQNLLMYH